MLTPLCARRGAPCWVCAALLASGLVICCAALVRAAELPPSTGAAAGQPATVRPLLPPGPLGPLNEADLGLAAALAPPSAGGPFGSMTMAGPNAPFVPGMGTRSPLGPPGVPAAALAQPAGTLIGPENAVGPNVAAAAAHERDAAGHGDDCGCPDCAAAGEGPQIYAPATAPMYAPSDDEMLTSGWLPEIREDWFGRPVYGGAYAGVMKGSEIIASQLKLDPGLLTGVRIGQDTDRRWTWETRFAYATPSVVNLQGPELRREGDLFLADSTLIYTRYATKRFRPYLSAGMGMGYLDVTDQHGNALREFLPTLPVGAGMQYRYNDWFVLHLEFGDTLMFGKAAGLERMINDLSVSGGLEFRFGVSPNVYYPWMDRTQSEW